MLVEISIRFPFEFPAQNGLVQYPHADNRANEEIFTVELAEETIVFRQLGGYLVHLARLIKRPYNKQDLLPPERSFSQHTDSKFMVYPELDSDLTQKSQFLNMQKKICVPIFHLSR